MFVFVLELLLVSLVIYELNAHLLTISGNQYYIMIKGSLKVEDNVEIKYLPKSTIVLEVKIIEIE